MKAIIFAAGKGTRMGESSASVPKPMQKVLGKTLIEHKLDVLPKEIDSVLIVVGHLKEKIMDFFGDTYIRNRKERGSGFDDGHSISITYIEQDELLGSAHCLFLCKDHLKDDKRFLVLMGDDIYAKEDMEECMAHDCALLLNPVDSLKNRAKVVFNEQGFIEDILEKYQGEEAGFANAGMYSLTPAIFEYPMVAIGNGEYGLPQTILAMMKNQKPVSMTSVANPTGGLTERPLNINAVKARFWLQISSPEDIVKAEEVLAQQA